MTSIEITCYIPIYKEPVINLVTGIQANEFALSITRQDQPDLEDIPLYYQKDGGEFWVALHENTVVGTLGLFPLDSQHAALRKIFVAKEHRGKEKAVADKLMKTVLQWCQESGIHHVYLETFPEFVAAQRFYEKNGFHKISIDALPASFPVVCPDKSLFYVNTLTTMAS